uniref:Putative secreted protein n=1 Tax=Ixodes ricinus TaxID=34613 RepID=A0A147BQ63_IXORI
MFFFYSLKSNLSNFMIISGFYGFLVVPLARANEKWVDNFRRYDLHNQNFLFVLAGSRKWNRATLVTVCIFGQPACL